LLVCTGAEMESGWLPALLRQSGNPRVQDGQPGHFEAAVFVKMQEAPPRVDRAGRDLHAQGNPHINTAPSTFTTVARALAYRLAEVDGDNASVYKTRLADFQARWAVANERWSLAAAPLKGQRVAVQHDGFPYLAQWLGLQQVAVLEAKPGVEPGHDDLAQALKQEQQHPVRMVIRAAYSEGRSASWLAEQAQVPVVVLPATVGGSERAKDLFGLFDDTVDQLLKGLRL
jgi:zinc/manganese transport system substrate-binding protein